MKIRHDDDFEIKHGKFTITSGDDDHIWVEIDNIQIKVAFTAEGVVVDFWPTHQEDDIPLESAYVSFQDATKEDE